MKRFLHWSADVAAVGLFVAAISVLAAGVGILCARAIAHWLGRRRAVAQQARALAYGMPPELIMLSGQIRHAMVAEPDAAVATLSAPPALVRAGEGQHMLQPGEARRVMQVLAGIEQINALPDVRDRLAVLSQLQGDCDGLLRMLCDKYPLAVTPAEVSRQSRQLQLRPSITHAGSWPVGP